MPDQSHTRGGVLALATAAITLVGALVTAGVIHVNSADGAHPSGVESVAAGPNPPAPIPSTPASDSSWVDEVSRICTATQTVMDEHRAAVEAGPSWDKAAYEGRVFMAMDALISQVSAPADVRTRLQLMTQDWDTASAALIRAGDAGDRGDLAQVSVEMSGYADPNGRGNQIAADLGLAVCAQVGLP